MKLNTDISSEKAESQGKATETLILEAAEREFLEKGFAGAKTASIAEAAGVTHAMLHYYFRTKEKLFEKIVADKMGRLMELMFRAVGNPELPLRERLVRGVEDHFDFVAANPLLPRFVFNEIYTSPEKLETFKRVLLARAGAILEGLQLAINAEAGAGRCRQADAVMVFLDIISLNIFPFVASPVIDAMCSTLLQGYTREELLENRKRENVRTVLSKLDIL